MTRLLSTRGIVACAGPRQALASGGRLLDPPAMARKRSSMVPAWLRHRQILTTEAVLLVGIGVELLQRWITGRPDVPWWAKTLEVMLVNAGMLGGVLLLVTGLTRGSLSGATRAVQSVPLPAALLLVHLMAGVALFALYAWVWGFWPVRAAV